MSHQPVKEEVSPWECVYGECEHGADCEPQTVEVCDTCRGPMYDDEIETFVPWPCEFVAASPHSGDGDT